MNIQAGLIHVTLVDIDNVITARADVLVEGTRAARFEVPLDPELRDIRDDIATVTARAADTMIALVREIEPYKVSPPGGGEAQSPEEAPIAITAAPVDDWRTQSANAGWTHVRKPDDPIAMFEERTQPQSALPPRDLEQDPFEFIGDSSVNVAARRRLTELGIK